MPASSAVDASTSTRGWSSDLWRRMLEMVTAPHASFCGATNSAAEQNDEDLAGQFSHLLRRLGEVDHEGVGSERREIQREGQNEVLGRFPDTSRRSPRNINEMADSSSSVPMPQPVTPDSARQPSNCGSEGSRSREG